MRNARLFALALTLAAATAAPALARAHCDTADGPVALAAARALDAGKPDLALAWVQPSGDAEIRDAFARALAVRKLGPDARALADRWFLENLVRVHRAGEGAPYTGVKPAGADAGPAVRAADAAVAARSPAALDGVVKGAANAGARARLETVLRLRPAAERTVEDGRAYVAAYVEYVHFVEGAAAGAPEPHGAHGAAPAHPHQH
jgi:Family of unknown function (DUF6448)